jgi:hypothetical protein
MVNLGVDVHAHEVLLDFDETYAEACGLYDRAREEHIRTRLGDDSIRLRLPAPVRGYYAPSRQTDSVDVPFYVVDRAMGADGEIPIERVRDEENTFLLAERRRIRYTPSGWMW